MIQILLGHWMFSVSNVRKKIGKMHKKNHVLSNQQSTGTRKSSALQLDKIVTQFLKTKTNPDLAAYFSACALPSTRRAKSKEAL